MVRVLLGLLKGGVVGALLGWGALKLGVTAGFLAFLTYGLIGGLVGIVCGRPPWRQDTFWTPALKGLFGIGVGIGLFWVARKLLGGVQVGFAAQLGAPGKTLAEIPLVLGPLIGGVWGLLVEVDDSGGAPAKAAAGKPATKA
jgi:hypothetical protein